MTLVQATGLRSCVSILQQHHLPSLKDPLEGFLFSLLAAPKISVGPCLPLEKTMQPQQSHLDQTFCTLHTAPTFCMLHAALTHLRRPGPVGGGESAGACTLSLCLLGFRTIASKVCGWFGWFLHYLFIGSLLLLPLSQEWKQLWLFSLIVSEGHSLDSFSFRFYFIFNVVFNALLLMCLHLQLHCWLSMKNHDFFFQFQIICLFIYIMFR